MNASIEVPAISTFTSVFTNVIHHIYTVVKVVSKKWGGSLPLLLSPPQAPPAGSGAEPQPKLNLVYFSLKI